MDERQFFNESRTTRDAVLVCPRCREKNTYKLRWMVRRKKSRLPGRADERDRAKFAKAQSYMLLLDDLVSCTNTRCRARIEVSGIKTTAFLEDPQSGKLPEQPPERPSRGRPRNRPDVDGNRADVDGNRADVSSNRTAPGNRAAPGNRRRSKRRRGPQVRFPSDTPRRRRR